MIAEKMQRTIDNMRRVLARGNGDFEQLAPFFLDSLESEVERVAGLEGAAMLDFADAPRKGRDARPQAFKEVING